MASLYNIRSVALFALLALAAFLRFDELATAVAKLVRSDASIESDMLKLFIQASKTDRYRNGTWIVLLSSGKVTRPVAMMKRYLERTKLSYNSPFFVSFQKLNVAISLDLKV